MSGVLQSFSETSADYFGRRRSLTLDSPSVNRLENLYAGGFFRTPYQVQQNNRKYFAQPDPPINSLLSVLSIPFVAPQAIHGLSEIDFVYRRRQVQQPLLYRPDVTPVAPPSGSTPFFGYGEAEVIFDRDRLKGQDFDATTYLLIAPQIAHEQPSFLKRKTWLIPDFGVNNLVPIGTLIIHNPFPASVDEPEFLYRARQPRFDDPPNVQAGVYNIPAGPPFYQLDWITPQRSYNKYLTLWNYIDPIIPNPLIPPAPPVIYPGAGPILGVFSQNRIIGYIT